MGAPLVCAFDAKAVFIIAGLMGSPKSAEKRMEQQIQ